jgi:hypothetical protein
MDLPDLDDLLAEFTFDIGSINLPDLDELIKELCPADK